MAASAATPPRPLGGCTKKGDWEGKALLLLPPLPRLLQLLPLLLLLLLVVVFACDATIQQSGSHCKKLRVLCAFSTVVGPSCEKVVVKSMVASINYFPK